MTIFNGTSGDDYIVGSDENDDIYGLEGINNLRGGLGDDLIEGGSSEDYLLGEDGADTINGYDGNDNIFGGLGNDTLDGGAGNDWIDGGDGDDLLISGAGYDRLYGGAGNDTFIVTPDYTCVWGGEGIDTLSYQDEVSGVTVTLTDTVGYSHTLDSYDLTGSSIGGTRLEEIENVTGGAGWDYIVGNSSDNVFIGNGGVDNLRGGAGDDTLEGGEGSDYLMGEDGNDTIRGGTDNDSIFGGNGDDTISGDEGNDYIYGGDGADTIDGGEGRDIVSYMDSTTGVIAYLDGTAGTAGYALGDIITNTEYLIGSSYNDELYGDSGNNIFDGRSGADIISGGEGIDFVIYDTSTAGVTVYLDGTAGVGGYAQGDIISGVEHIRGSAYGDTLYGNNEDNTLWGMAGNDTLEGGAGADTLYGGDGTNTLSYSLSSEGVTVSLDGTTVSGGDAEGDVFTDMKNLTGSAFDDILTGDDNINTILGGDGNDQIRGGAGADILDGGAGTADALLYDNSDAGVIAYISGSGSTGGYAEGDINSGFEIMQGSAYNDILYGTAGNETIMGNAGDDYIYAGNGSDTLYGGDGNDFLHGGAFHTNAIDGGNGIDTVSYQDAYAVVAVLDYWTSETLTNIENVIGSAGNDVIGGNDQVNILYGGDGVDRLYYTHATAGIQASLVDGTVLSGAIEATGDIVYEFENLEATNFDDILSGNDLNNTITALNGDDFITSDLGADSINGGNGTDTVSYINSDSGITITNDIYANKTGTGGDAEGDVLYSIEILYGSNYADIFYGSNGVDIIYGNDGNDEIYGGYSNDIISGGKGADILDGGGYTAGYTDRDTITYEDSESGVTLYLDGTVSCTGGDAEGDIVTGFEVIKGSNYDDIIYGQLYVQETIYGNGGGDILYGSVSNDTFAFLLESDSTSSNYDTIMDYDAGASLDYLAFEDTVFGNSTANFLVDTSSGTETVITHTYLTDFELHLDGIHGVYIIFI